MSSVNKAIILGNVGKDPEVRYMPDGKAAANFSIATTSSWKDKEGKKQEQTEWHRISAFGKLAEIIESYVKKGSQLYIEGRITTRKWKDKDGQEKYTTEIIADQMQMLGNKVVNSDQPPRQKQAGDDDTAPRKKDHFSDLEDDVAF